MGEGIAGKVAQNGEAVRIENIADSEDFVNINASGSNPIQSILCLPIASEKGVVGVLNLSHPKAGMFSEENNRVLNLIANQASFAFRNYYMFEELKKNNISLEESNERLKAEICERQKTEEKLKMSAAVYENAIEGVMVTDPSGVIQFINPAFTEITGYSEEESIGNNPRILKSDRNDKKFYEKMWGSLLKTGGWQGDIWNRRKNGEAYLQQMTIQAIKNEAGQTTQYTSVFNDITEIRRQDEAIKYQAHHDPLTGLPNRQLLFDRLGQTISRAKREELKFAILFIDIDNLKKINDSLGHLVGDRVLQGIAISLVVGARGEDTVSRLSGDEFTIILENIRKEKDAAIAAERIIDALSEPFNHQGKEFQITASIGIAIHPTDGESAEELLRKSDMAMYQVKDFGKNNYRFFDKSLDEEAKRRFELELLIQKGIDQNEFIVYYQPKVSLSSGKITGMEALVRWKTEETILFPSSFIPLAENTGLIIPIGESVLFQACKQQKAWQDKGHKDFTVSVNISARQLDRKTLLEVVRSALDETGLEAKSLCLEVTESAIMNDMSTALFVLEELKKIGVKVSLDDFGTGYSSLSHVRKLPIDELKIDRFFIMSIPGDTDDTAIATTIILLAQNLRLSVVAEGVETESQLDFLRSAGCDEMQGYLFSHPLPAEEMEKLLKDGKTLSFG